MGTNGNTVPSEHAGVHLAGPHDLRLRFSGPPRALAGTIPLINKTSEKQKIRSLAVNSDKLLGAASLPLREIPFHARLHGGEQLNIPVRLVVHAQTPPGTYHLELSVGARTVPATVLVTEVVDLRVHPREITILAGSASSYTRKFSIENAGNVPLPMGARCECPLFEPVDLVSSMLIGLHKADKASAESLVKGFLTEWSDLSAGTLVVKREPMILGPGQKAVVDVEFHLPPELKPHRHYHANLQLYNAVGPVEIYTTAKVGADETRKSDQSTRKKK
jgi:hypothetical protein